MERDHKKLPPLRRLPVKGLAVALLGGALGVLLLLVGGVRESGERGDAVESTEYGENGGEALNLYTEELEKRIAAICESVSGVSGVRVAVTLESGFEYVYAKENGAGDGEGDRYVTVGNGSSEHAVYLSYLPPRIAGVGIVCRGGGRAEVRKELIELVSAAFDVSFGDIYVAEGS